MKVFIFNFEYPPLGGGGGVATRDIASELAKRHEVHVITTAWAGLPRQEEDRGAHIHRVWAAGRRELPTATVLSMALYVPFALWKGFTLSLKGKPDVINAQFVLPSGLPAAGLAWLLRRPLVVSLIGGDIYDPSKGISPHRHGVLRWLVRCICRYADARTAISNDTRKRAVELHGIREAIDVVPLGLVPSRFEQVRREELAMPADGPVFVSVGRLIPRKRYEDLIDAWKAVKRGALVIIGSGLLEQELKERVEREGLTDRIIFSGQVSEERKHQMLQAADGYVSAAEHEGFGIVFLEAMHAGLPIAAVGDGGQTDFLENGVNALLTSPRDPHAMAMAVNRLAEDGALRETMGDANRRKVKEYYTEKTVARFEDVLVRAISN